MEASLFFTPEHELPPDAGFTLWGREHLLWLAISLCIGAALCVSYRRLGRRGRTKLRAGTGCAVLLCEIAKDANLIIQGVMSVYYLPLHLCGIAVFFTLFHCLRPGETAGEFLYSVCMPGAVFAVLFPDWTGYPAFSYHSLVGFLVHTLLISYPLMQLLGGDLRPDPRRLPRCLVILAVLAAAVYAFDRAVSANYMYLLLPAPGSPLEWFERKLGNPGYLLGYVPMLAGVWLVLYLPFLIGAPRHRRS